MQMKFIPAHKDDQLAVRELKKTEWQELVPYVDALLEWLKDFNWPVARGVSEVLSAHTNSIKKNIINVLRGNDGIWKYWCIQCLIYHSEESSIDQDLILELQRIVDLPSKDDMLEGVDEVALEALERWQSV